MTSYKQEIKEISRQIIWEKAITSLTEKRKEIGILNTRYISKLWIECYNQRLIPLKLAENFDKNYLDKWVSFANQYYSSKNSDELKIAYLSGPEPENDLEVLLRLGIRIENVWAFEGHKETFNKALNSIKEKYPTLKIFPGKFDSFIEASPVKFDIIYMDFTGPLFSPDTKPFVAVNKIFENQILSDLGIIIINSCLPDKNDNNISFLANYFNQHPTFEDGILNGTPDPEEGMEISYSEGFSTCGIIDPYKILKCIDNNFEETYSAFITHYPIYYANIINPSFLVLQSDILRKRIFADIKKNIEPVIKNLYKDPDKFIMELYPFWYFTMTLSGGINPDKAWKNHFTEKVQYANRELAAQVAELVITYEQHQEILSDTLYNEIPLIDQNLPDKNGGLFCDVPMYHLWLQLAINQFGHPYHINLRNHFRAKYRAKERKMFFDIYTFDKCRALYDWLPNIEFYGNDLSVLERQMITRVCIDAIGKAKGHLTLPQLYYGSAIVGMGNTTEFDFADTPRRIDLNSEDVNSLYFNIPYL